MDPAHQKMLSNHLAGCTFLPGHSHKRFAYQLANQDPPFSPRQLWYLCFLVNRYRKQITIPDVVNLAKVYLQDHPVMPKKPNSEKKSKKNKSIPPSNQISLF